MAAYHTTFVVLCTLYWCLCSNLADGRSFTVDWDNDCFLKDGKPFRYISGSIHYTRIPKFYWQDRLKKMYTAGLNAVQIYIPWNVHEPTEGKFVMEGDADLPGFLQLANDTGLLVIARIGPYICGEWDMGGLPSWLLKNNPKIQLRSSDPDYLNPVDKWLDTLFQIISLYLYKNKGPIISVQIENEYGSYYSCDYDYLRFLRNKAMDKLGDDVVLFTTDGPTQNMLKCGTLQNVLTTVDFGSGKHTLQLSLLQINSEYYTGWLDHWASPHSVVNKDRIVKTLDSILAMNASVNMYMFIGGTNFGFMNGANYYPYKPQPTSYDYDAPLTEAGDPTDKYMAIRKVIGQYRELPPDPIPPPTPKSAYGKVTMSKISTFYDELEVMAPYGPINTTYPITMEDMQQSYGFILYRTTINEDHSSSVLSIPGIGDRGYVCINQTVLGILSRMTYDPNLNTSLNITAKKGDILDILIENQGRINYGKYINDSKGIVGNATLANVTIQSWSIYSLDMDLVVNPGNFMRKKNYYGMKYKPSASLEVASFYTGVLSVDNVQDTYLNMKGWTKGQVYINGFNLGRYWPVVGPQVTLYVPANILQTGDNTVVLFELEKAPCTGSYGNWILAGDCQIEFIDRPIINGTALLEKNTDDEFDRNL
uniref:Beta-galactosidase-like n=1 Tax=Saccoglossus kowalevskii TaxID=10224 RepID=A0ABM0MM43_SACKO|nr:PREDICTED: beta-galactosidase-like [Saccoglossus kowalevskii]